MSALFRARVEKIHGRHCHLRLFIVHPDQTSFYGTLPFALQVLLSHAYERQVDSALSKLVPPERFGDEDLVYAVCEEVLTTVAFGESKNHPRTVDLDSLSDDEFDAYWRHEDGLPQQVLEIEATSPDWLEGFAVGDTWDTSAWNL